jgi:hypothetical protein
LAHTDELRDATDAEQLVAVIEAVTAAESTHAIIRIFRGKPLPPGIDLDRWRSIEDLANYSTAAVAALLLAYSGLWPTNSTALALKFAAACGAASSVASGAFDRALRGRPPSIRDALRREQKRIEAFD